MESPSNHCSLVTLTETQRAQALQHFRLIRPLLEEGVPLTQIAAEHPLSVRTLRRWVRQYRAHGLAGLIRAARKDQGQRRSVTSHLQQVIEGLALQKPRRTVANIHRETARISHERNWTPPSYSTIKRIVSRIDPALTTLAHEGAKAYQEEFDLIYRHQASTPNEVWQADHSLLPIFILNEQGKPAKPWLTVILDNYSRAICRISSWTKAVTQIKTSVKSAFFSAKEPWQVPRAMHNPHDFNNFFFFHGAVKQEVPFKLLEGVKTQPM
jgi:putative transposase